MGIALWIGCGLAAFVLARILPVQRATSWIADLAASLAGALAAGLAATRLDFGGWRVLDWRAGAFAFAVALAMTGILRVIGAVRASK